MPCCHSTKPQFKGQIAHKVHAKNSTSISKPCSKHTIPFLPYNPSQVRDLAVQWRAQVLRASTIPLDGAIFLTLWGIHEVVPYPSKPHIRGSLGNQLLTPTKSPTYQCAYPRTSPAERARPAQVGTLPRTSHPTGA